MATQTSLRIKAERLGTTAEIRNFLTDIENVYNICYLIDRIQEGQPINLKSLVRSPKQKISPKKDETEHPDMPTEDRKHFLTSFNLINFAPKSFYSPSRPSRITTRIQKEVSKTDQLSISKINIQSPGFWEFAGSLNPLTQIREFLKDQHERKKDNDYRIAQEKKKGELEIISRRLDLIQKYTSILEKAKYSDEQIRDGIDKLIQEPLDNLRDHQNSGLIEGPEE